MTILQKTALKLDKKLKITKSKSPSLVKNNKSYIIMLCISERNSLKNQNIEEQNTYLILWIT